MHLFAFFMSFKYGMHLGKLIFRKKIFTERRKQIQSTTNSYKSLEIPSLSQAISTPPQTFWEDLFSWFFRIQDRKDSFCQVRTQHKKGQRKKIHSCLFTLKAEKLPPFPSSSISSKVHRTLFSPLKSEFPPIATKKAHCITFNTSEYGLRSKTRIFLS